eukprot:TRINITY_DN3118_c0_g1_i3.p1 TRINITY_DN3118_c0_g1~~TRINITY_DN3118_c0_g1_i3.p1  ORF type:complete len:587 (-),score=161.85 TRINITY_DN3118_c0_g1_i3:41-1630(-)
MDSDQDGFVTDRDFEGKGLGTIIHTFVSNAIFKTMDTDSDGKIDFKDFLNSLKILQKGEIQEQIRYAFQMMSPDSEGLVTRENFQTFMTAIERSLGSIQFDVKLFVEKTFDEADSDVDGKISARDYISVAESKLLFIQSLGLIDEIPKGQVLARLNGIVGEGYRRRKNIPITFGHQSWDLSYNILFGIRIAVAEAFSSHLKAGDKPLEQRDFELQIDYELKSFSDSNDSWTFREYAPLAFVCVREAFRISHKHYMFSLGSEKLLGNFLLGNFGALCELMSSGRSGSFFFKSADNQFLIKTLPIEEHRLLQTKLASYLQYVRDNPNTLMARYVGLHSMRKGTEKLLHLCVMSNLFEGPFPIHEQYDLKGSTVGRHVELDSQSQGDIALKDNDFKRHLNVGIRRKSQLLEQIENDTKWLESHGICDYSFLVGICFLDRLENGQKIAEEVESFSSELYCRNSIFRREYGGMLSTDKKEIYFVGIIDTLTTYNFKKMGEFFAKSLYNPSDQISAISPEPYRKRFLKYLETIIE